MYRLIKDISEIDINRLTMSQALRVFTTRKKYLILSPNGDFHLVNNPHRTIMEKYRIHEAYDMDIYEL